MSEREWTPELTQPLREVLGLMNFQTGPVAHIYRAAGHDIPKKCEDEQAFVLHRFVGIALEHGDKWREVVNADVKAAAELARASTKQPE